MWGDGYEHQVEWACLGRVHAWLEHPHRPHEEAARRERAWGGGIQAPSSGS